ncbi:MAG: hypothetical protein AAF734_10110, partial [Bacteroidota bacterium]
MYQEEGGVLLFEVIQLIVEEAPSVYYSKSDYPKGAFYIRAATKPIGTIGKLYFRNGKVATNLTKGFTKEEKEEMIIQGDLERQLTITLNYTWGYDPKSQKATPLGTALAITIEPSVATNGQCYPFT